MYLLLDEIGGSSIDWAYYDNENIYSYAVELRDLRRYGKRFQKFFFYKKFISKFKGFELPSNQIIDCGSEIFEGVIALALHIKNETLNDKFNETMYPIKDQWHTTYHLNVNALPTKSLTSGQTASSKFLSKLMLAIISFKKFLSLI